MKRYGNLFDECFSEENLYQAYLNARKRKRSKRSCYEFEKNLGVNLAKLREEILSGTYQPKPYFEFPVYEPKKRIIHAPAFRDIVAQHAVYKIIYPIFNKTFVDTNFACRIGKGTHRCADYVQSSMRKCSHNSYILHLDIRKFFYSIDQDILIKLIEQKIKDQKLLKIIAQYMRYREPLGLPIGNLLSQLYASIYLNQVDHFVKRDLKAKFYTRYVDDMVLIGLTLDQSHDYKQKIESFVGKHLNLGLSKALIVPIRKGLNFVGYRTWRSKRFVRKHSMFKFSRSLKKENLNSLNSLIAHSLKTSTFAHYVKRIKQEKPKLVPLLPVMRKYDENL